MCQNNLRIFQSLPYKAGERLGTILAFQKNLLMLIVNSKETGLPIYYSGELLDQKPYCFFRVLRFGVWMPSSKNGELYVL